MDAVSYSHSAKQAQRIEKFIENPDSNSGIVTVPKVIGAGESVTVPAGRMAVLPNVQVDGTLNVEGEVFIPSGASVSTTEIDATIVKQNGSVVADDSAVVHKTGNETIAGVKTFSDGIKLQNQNVSPFSGFKNYIINGNFDVWQYGTSQTANGYGSDDRWFNATAGSTKTHSQVACTDIERALFNASYFSRTVVSSVNGANNYVTKRTSIEDVTRLAGKTVTLSFWAKADSSKNIWVEFKQIFGTGGSPSPTVVGLYGQAVSLTSTWQKKTITLTLPSIIGKTLGTDGVHTSSTEIQFWFDVGSVNLGRIPTGIQQSGTFDIAQVQLEEGSVATPFENRPYGLELSLCQRYYQVLNSVGLEASGVSGNPTLIYAHFSEKRVSPTVLSFIPLLGTGHAMSASGTDTLSATAFPDSTGHWVASSVVLSAEL